eukprot:GSChrysophyteH1.ASY1.ANO1.3139.1 assembled CDS
MQCIALHDVLLDQQENEIFSVLINCLKWRGNESTTLRVAGGWVRDKLLGKSSSDIDIAIDDQTGVIFATSVNEYLKSIGVASHRLAVIMANPEQSKHIETAKLKVLGLPIDFVNLRSESYTEDSRVPDIKFGSAVEDAERRDLTINSLFYNINTATIEDLTNCGLKDLRNGIIRTPLNPLVTFRDDPLRILRTIRFSARLGFAIDDGIVQASRNAEVQHIFSNKVSRERMLIEVQGMLQHQYIRPAFAFRCMKYLGIYELVFDVSLTSSESEKEAISSSSDSSCNETSNGSTSGGSVNGIPLNTWKSLYLAAAVVGLRLLTCTDGNKKKETSYALVVLRDALKIDTETLKMVHIIHTAIPIFQSIISRMDISQSLIEIGLLLRSTMSLWKEILWISCAETLSQLQPHCYATPAAAPATEGILHSLSDIMCPLHFEVKQHILELDVVGSNGNLAVWEIKPVLDGNQLMQSIGLRRGPMIGKIMDAQLRWQLNNPAPSLHCTEDILAEYTVNCANYLKQCLLDFQS